MIKRQAACGSGTAWIDPAQLTYKLDTQVNVTFAIAGLVCKNDFNAQVLVRLMLATTGTLEKQTVHGSAPRHAHAHPL